MKKFVVDDGGYRFKWTVRGQDEDGCVADIQENGWHELTDYMIARFAEQYGCVAEVEKVRLMSHNAYDVFVRGNQALLSSNKGFTMDSFNRNIDGVEVVPFPLDGFRLSPEVRGFIEKRFSSISFNEIGDACLRCHLNSAFSVGLLAKELDCALVCNQGFSGFYKNDNNRLILGFEDGDVVLLVGKSQASYAKQLAEFERVYDVESTDVCLEVYFDGVHMDNLVVPRENVRMAISSLLQRGYDGCDSALKDCWEGLMQQTKLPNMGFRVVEFPTMVRDVDFLISSASDRSVEGNGKEVDRQEKEIF